MIKVSLSGEEKSLEDIYSWYQDQSEAIRDFKNKVIGIDNGLIINKKFITLTFNEIDTYFSTSERELEHLVCLDLISATEAFLRVDYINRVTRKDKSKIGRAFRDIDRNKGNKVSLEVDIIETWKSINPHISFGNLLGLLKYRHWMAHGRFWKPKFGRIYTFDIAYEISSNIFDIVAKHN